MYDVSYIPQTQDLTGVIYKYIYTQRGMGTPKKRLGYSFVMWVKLAIQLVTIVGNINGLYVQTPCIYTRLHTKCIADVIHNVLLL